VLAVNAAEILKAYALIAYEHQAGELAALLHRGGTTPRHQQLLRLIEALLSEGGQLRDDVAPAELGASACTSSPQPPACPPWPRPAGSSWHARRVRTSRRRRPQRAALIGDRACGTGDALTGSAGFAS